MGVVSTVGFDKFPAQNTERLGVEDSVEIEVGFDNTVTLHGTVIRSDSEHPFREILVLDADQFDDKVVHYHDSVSRKVYPENFAFMENVSSKFCAEGKEVEVMFNYNTKQITKAICIFDRGPLTLFKLLGGVNENKIISSGECQYSEGCPQ